MSTEWPAPVEGPLDRAERDRGVARATEAYLLFVALPAWTIPGFADYLCHRATKIERTSGTHESLTHGLMMTAVGIPTLLALVFKINGAVLAALAAATAVHECIVIWDVAYAADRRRVTTLEQHIHSFLEVLPFTSLSLIACLHWDQVLGLVGRGPCRPAFRLELKDKLPPPLYLAAIGALVTATIGIPYAEEFIRCFRVDGTIAPRRKPID